MSSNLNDSNSELVILSPDSTTSLANGRLRRKRPTENRRNPITSTTETDAQLIVDNDIEYCIDLTKETDDVQLVYNQDPSEIAIIKETKRNRPNILQKRRIIGLPSSSGQTNGLDSSVIIDDQNDALQVSPPKILRTQAKLPTNNNNDDSIDRPDEPKCPICLETLHELKAHGKNLMSTFCGHIICNTCVDEHFKASQLKSKTITCPTCRTKITRNKIHVLYL